jgi:hypothetical protein
MSDERQSTGSAWFPGDPPPAGEPIEHVPEALLGRPRSGRQDERRVRRGSERLPDMVIVNSRRRVVRDRVDLVGNDLTATLRWCSEHNEPVWEFGDGSYECPHDVATGVPTDGHELVDGPWELPDGWAMMPEEGLL